MSEIGGGSGSVEGRTWINRLPRVVAPQAAALMRLLEAGEADPRVRALEIKGSMARGAADEHSDLDTLVWIGDDDFDAAVADLPSLDFDGTLPERLEETVAGLDAADLRRAGYACAELLAAYDQRPFGDFFLARLATSD